VPRHVGNLVKGGWSGCRDAVRAKRDVVHVEDNRCISHKAYIYTCLKS
jgi:hypothetical protein